MNLILFITTILSFLAGTAIYFISNYKIKSLPYFWQGIGKLTLKEIIQVIFISIFNTFIVLQLVKNILFENGHYDLVGRIAILIISVIIIELLIYLGLADLRTMSVPYGLTLFLIIALLILNIVLLFSFGLNSQIILWGNNAFTPLYNLIGGFIGGLVIGFIVFISKEELMGEGDIYLFAALGLILGVQRFISGFYITIFTASIVGIIWAIMRGKFKGVKMPLVPFIVLGIIFTMLYWPEVSNFMLSLFGMSI